MAFRKISPDVKRISMRLLEEGWTVEEVAQLLGVSTKSLSRWRDNLNDYGDVIPPRSYLQGRPRIIQTALLETIHLLFDDDCDMYLDELQHHLAVFHDLDISISALQATLERAGLTRKVLTKIAVERDENRRAEFVEHVKQNFRADQILALDECYKDERTIWRKRGRSMSGEEAHRFAPFQRGNRYSILPAMSVEGYVAIRIVEGSIDAQMFYDFVVEDVLPLMSPYPDSNSVLLMDNCAIHKNIELIATVEAAGCIVLFLPPYSPDYNPIELSFSSLKYYLRRNYRTISEAEDPEAVLLDACGHITADKAAAWFRECGYE